VSEGEHSSSPFGAIFRILLFGIALLALSSSPPLEASQQALTLPSRASHIDAEHRQSTDSATEETTLRPALEGLRGEHNEPQAAKDFKISLETLLDENGRLLMPEGFSGSIDPQVFELVSQNGGAPRLFAQSAPMRSGQPTNSGFQVVITLF